ncbi:putative mycofactocin radical SAM maturase MftC [Pillotina sp. SPG140]|jgi:radical SAM protein with 4Fe4S-binding SPASM domain
MNPEQLLRYSINTAPIRVEFELTERCNLACCFCYNSQKPTDSKLAIEIIQRIAEEGVPEIVLTGGEPLLHPDFTQILAYCSKLFVKVMIQTNGTLINDAIADSLYTNAVYEVNISLHGDATRHDRLTQVTGSHHDTVEALKCLTARGIRVSSNFVLTKTNIGALSDNIDLLYENGVRCITLTRFTPTGVGFESKELALTREEIVNAISLADSKKRQLNGLSVLLANSMPRCALPQALSNYCEHCHFGASRFYIDISGNVLMCGMSRTSIGNILNDNFVDIKKNSDVFQNHILGDDVPAVCKQCGDFHQCRGGCRAAALAHSNSLCGKDPYIMQNSNGGAL